MTIVVHGGAGPVSTFIREQEEEIRKGLEKAAEMGYSVLNSGGTAAEAVEAAVRVLEDDKHFNAGRGSSLTAEGEVEMCTSIMDGKTRTAGAAAIVKEVKNPIRLAKTLMDDAACMYIGGTQASKVAEDLELELEPEAYFVTDHQVDTFLEERANHPKMSGSKVFRRYQLREHGTVGAVAVDKHGNVAAGTSTGGTSYAMPGRIGDSSMIGVGSYADNATAAISSTGDGEYLIREVMAHGVSAAMEHTRCTVQEACDYMIKVRNKDTKGDLGVIAVDAEGNIGISYNSERMLRAWKTADGTTVEIY